jgi:hypothetical protein
VGSPASAEEWLVVNPRADVTDTIYEPVTASREPGSGGRRRPPACRRSHALRSRP